MGTLMNENPSYTITYSVPATGERKTRSIRRDRLRAGVEKLRKDIRNGVLNDVTVINRFGVDVTVDWFG